MAAPSALFSASGCGWPPELKTALRNRTRVRTGGGLAPVAGGCREDGRAQFNTAVAFDADGGLLEKCHRHHLSKEQGWFDVDANLTRKGRFTPSFGVEFGLFICYDITFERAEPDAVTNSAFPTFWGPEGAAAEQHAVNLLAANIGGLGTSGLGIYSAGAALAQLRPDEAGCG